MSTRTHKPIAVLLVHPSDLPASEDRPTKQYYEDLFLHDELSINNYWITMSDGLADIEGTMIFDWRSHGMTRMAFSGLERDQKILRAVEISMHDIDFTKFDSVVVFGDPSDELGSSGIMAFSLPQGNHTMGTAIYPQRTDHNLICHEVGHAFGLDHSFDDSPTAHDPGNDNRPGAYGDHWDIMSAGRVTSFTSKYGRTGPGLNTVMRDINNWLLPSRIIDGNSMQNELVTIYDNTNPDTSRPQVLRIEDYYFEFSFNSGWYAAFGNSSIQVRMKDYNQGEHSKMIKVSDTSHALRPRQSFKQEYKSARFKRTLKVEFESINVAEKSANLRVTHLIELVTYIDPEIHRRRIKSDLQILSRGNVFDVPVIHSFRTILDSLGIISTAYAQEKSDQKQILFKTAREMITRELDKLEEPFLNNIQ